MVDIKARGRLRLALLSQMLRRLAREQVTAMAQLDLPRTFEGAGRLKSVKTAKELKFALEQNSSKSI